MESICFCSLFHVCDVNYCHKTCALPLFFNVIMYCKSGFAREGLKLDYTESKNRLILSQNRYEINAEFFLWATYRIGRAHIFDVGSDRVEGGPNYSTVLSNIIIIYAFLWQLILYHF